MNKNYKKEIIKAADAISAFCSTQNTCYCCPLGMRASEEDPTTARCFFNALRPFDWNEVTIEAQIKMKAGE